MKRNKFSLSHYKLLSGKMGQLIPVGLTEVLPGDTFRHNISALTRIAPLQTPVMHPCHLSFRTFFVPSRILWTAFADIFITGGPDGLGKTFPTIDIPSGGFDVGSLGDYLGVPTGQGEGEPVNALPFRAYAAIYNEYFRDKQLQAELDIDSGGGNDNETNLDLQNCDWEKDYFTTSRPEPQLGPDVVVSLGERAPVMGIGKESQTFETASTESVYETDGSGTTDYLSSSLIDDTGTSNQFRIEEDPDNAGYPNIYADLSAATGISINDIREAFAKQSFQEHRSRYGDTYVEYLRYLGLKSSDARLQLPEYLGGFKTTIQFSEVLSQNGAASGNLGELGGHGIALGRSNGYQRYFEEHGYIMTLAYARPKTVYMNGLPRLFSKTQKEDFWQREFEHTGQQEVLNKEVYLGHTNPDDVFGYQDVYDEYRRQESQVSGEFRTTLKDWHLAREITTDTEGTLDADFVKAVPATDIYKATTADNIYMMVSHRLRARRLPSKTGYSSNL